MNRIRRRAFVLAVATAALVAAIFVVSASARPHATTITFWNTMNDQETVTLKTLVSQFEKEAGISVDIVQVPFDQRDAKFTTASQAGKGPDVMRAEIADVANWGAKGFLTDVTSRVTAADKADFLPAAFAYYNYAGKIWGLPQAPDALTIFYNKALFKQAGIAPTKLPKSLTELAATCSKFGEGKGIFLRADSYWVQPWVWGFGGGLIDPAKKQILIASAKSVQGLAAYAKLFSGKCAFPNKDFANDYGNAQTAFKNGQVAMIVNGPWSTADILTGPAFKSSSNLGVLVIPKGPGGGQGSPVGGNGFVIGKSSSNVDAAWKFIYWLTQPAQQAQFAAKNNLLPSRASAYALPEVKKNRLIGAFLPQMKAATARPVLPQGGQIYSDFGPNVQKVLSGQLSAKVALEGVAKAWKLKLFPDYSIAK